jgi:hypothetical protein
VRLIVRKDAEADIAAGYAWYEQRREGLGREFLEEITNTVASVDARPLRFLAVSRMVRRATVRRFPYGIFFVLRADTIFLIAAMRLARDPRRVHRRAK